MVRNRLLFILLLLPAIGHARVWTVDNSAGARADSASLQGVINAASSGDTIILMPSFLGYGSINITKKLLLYSEGFSAHLQNGNPDKLPILSTTTVQSGVSGLVMAGLVFAERLYLNGSTHKMLCNQFRGSVYNSSSQTLFEGNLFSGFTFTEMLELTGSSNNTIQNNYFSIRTGGSNYSNSFAMIKGGDSSNLIRNNLMVEVVEGGGGISGGGIRFFLNTSARVRNNILWSNVSSRSPFQAGNSASLFQNNITYSVANKPDTLPGFNYNDTMPLFEGGFSNSIQPYYRTGNDLRLKSNSPGKNGGTDSTDPGLYGRSFVFSMYGIPAWLAQFAEMTITDPKPKQNQTIKVRIKIHP